MVIENNPKELAAMKKFHEGNRAEGLKLQEEFASEFREEYKPESVKLKESQFFKSLYF